MKKLALYVLAMFLAASGCVKQNSAENGNEPFYYYEGEEPSLKQIENKIFIQFIPNHDIIDWEQWETERDVLINSITGLRESSDVKWRGGSFYWVVLESKDGKPVPQTTIEYFRASPAVATVSFPLEVLHSGVMQGLTDDFVVKLKETTTFTQLELLAEQNHCNVEEVGRFFYRYEEDLIWVTVSKTSKLNALQMSDLFYETGLFESAQPNFVILNQSGVRCEEKRIIKVLKDEPAFIWKGCFEHVGRKEVFGLKLVNEHLEFMGVFPIEEIPKQFRKEGLTVYVSGNVTTCLVAGGCIEPNIRLSPSNLIELKSIKINK